MRKIADIVENMGQTVTRGYKAIETGAVSGYKAIENGAVTGYEKVSDKCVEILFAKEGEFVEEAKARLAANRKTKD
ncbi:MAG: hypothetical protein SPI68_04065 [Candidatus Faecousia sp.]|nr:hypothetical protein [Eubacteriales bacterium]MDY6066857.1 hypothetical protein [Candidatus Faecousia sp.]